MTNWAHMYPLSPTLSPSCDLLPSGSDRSRPSSPATRPILPQHRSFPSSPASLLAALAPPSLPAARGALALALGAAGGSSHGGHELLAFQLPGLRVAMSSAEAQNGERRWSGSRMCAHRRRGKTTAAGISGGLGRRVHAAWARFH
jgi:hypothetical protein